MAGFGRTQIMLAAAAIAGVVIGGAVGYVAWGWPKDWYVFNDPENLPAGDGNDLIRAGYQIVVNTAATIGPLAANAADRYAGNQLACTNCHLNAGLQPFSAPFVSTFASYPRMEMDTVETLAERLNGCLTRSLNGKPMPEGSDPMNALIAYIQYLGVGTPEGVRVPGMGLLGLPAAAETPDKTRGATVFANVCAKCHGTDGQGEANTTGGGYAVPPLWGDNSFNAAAGMATIDTAAAFIRANMPRGIDYQAPILTVQQAWDVAAFVTTQPRPPAPPAADQ